MHRKRVIDLDREECVSLLESAGIQCYDEESREILIVAIQGCLNDGDLTEDDLPEEDRDSILYGRGLGPRPFTG